MRSLLIHTAWWEYNYWTNIMLREPSIVCCILNLKILGCLCQEVKSINLPSMLTKAPWSQGWCETIRLLLSWNSRSSCGQWMAASGISHKVSRRICRPNVMYCDVMAGMSAKISSGNRKRICASHQRLWRVHTPCGNVYSPDSPSSTT